MSCNKPQGKLTGYIFRYILDEHRNYNSVYLHMKQPKVSDYDAVSFMKKKLKENKIMPSDLVY